MQPKVPDGLFVPGQNYKYPKSIDFDKVLDTHRVVEQIQWHLSQNKKGFFDYSYKPGEVEVEKDKFATLVTIMVRYMIGDFEECKKKRKKIIRSLKKNFHKDNCFYFQDYHMTTKLVVGLNLLLHENIKTKEQIPAGNEIEYLEKTIDWDGTLKDLWGALSLTYSQKGVDKVTKEKLRKYLYKKYKDVFEKAKKDEPRVLISKLYHFVNAIDFIGLEYPMFKETIDHMLSINYIQARKTCTRTICTDFDAAYMMNQYGIQSGYRLEEISKLITELSIHFVNDWKQDIDFLKGLTTAHLYDYLISISVFQKFAPQLFTGLIIPDIHHNLSLYRAN